MSTATRQLLTFLLWRLVIATALIWVISHLGLPPFLASVSAFGVVWGCLGDHSR